jgi:nicotinate phosphoribosyltransferase
MAHSFVQAHDSEAAAFERFARVRPKALTLLIDTYDTERGAALVASLAPRLATDGITVSAVRLDSGDLAAAGCQSIRIFASGGLDEEKLLVLVRSGAPIDGYGVGTSLTTSDDVPALDCAYKLQEYAGRARRKRSEGKATWPGRKQVYRRYNADGTIGADLVALLDEPASGEPLLKPTMRGGRRVDGLPSLAEARTTAAASLAQLPPALQRLEPHPVPVEISQGVRDLAAELDAWRQ